MRSYLDMLRQRHLLTLWVSQVLSAIGDQLHMIAVLWISVQVGGADAGFVVGAGSFSGLAVGLLGGVYADRWDRQKTMVIVDILRAVAVLSLAVAAHFGPLQLWQMASVAAIVCALGSLFEPCLIASVPALTDGVTLRAMTSLMIMTFRIARLVGPALAGLLLMFFPVYAFFVIDCLSYLISAAAIWSLGRNYAWRARTAPIEKGLPGIVNDLFSATRYVAGSGQWVGIFIVGFINCVLWQMAYVVGIPLWVKEAAAAGANLGVGSYAMIISAYGFGNVLSNIYFGTTPLTKGTLYYNALGMLILGIGFVIMAGAPNLYVACAGAALAAVGGPIGDIATIMFVQLKVSEEFRGRINGLFRVFFGFGGALGLMLAPILFAHLTAGQGIMLMAVAMLLVGIVGVALGARENKAIAPAVSIDVGQGVKTVCAVHDS